MVAQMDRVEKATLKMLQALWDAGEIPLQKDRQIDVEHQVLSKAHGRRRFRINITEIPALENK